MQKIYLNLKYVHFLFCIKCLLVLFNCQNHRIYIQYNNAIYDYEFLQIFCYIVM